MFELLFVSMILACMFFCFIGGVAAVMSELRRTDTDLYIAWMDRREARREIRKERK